jgi:hypothetical protein
MTQFGISALTSESDGFAPSAFRLDKTNGTKTIKTPTCSTQTNGTLSETSTPASEATCTVAASVRPTNAKIERKRFIET